jgi:hypothetical protein
LWSVWGKEITMTALLIVLAPLLVLMTWAVVYDLKRRRRRGAITNHDITSAARRVRGDAEGRG